MDPTSAPLPKAFFQRTEVTDIARELLGMHLITSIDGTLTGGKIVETEAYAGITDRASHAYGGRRTARTETLYLDGGVAYVYLCYGIHHLFNIVTGPQDTPHAVLIRGVEPLYGVEQMMFRRNMATLKPQLSAGPGALSKALGIDRRHNAQDLEEGDLWIADAGERPSAEEIVSSARIGVAYAKEDALLPWRFSLKGNPYVSKPRPGQGGTGKQV